MNRLLLLFFVVSISLTANSQTGTPQLKLKKGRYVFVKEGKRKLAIKRKFSFANSFSEGYALIEENLKFGYIDTKGESMIPCQYYDAGDFSDGLAYFSNGGKYGYIDKNSKVLIKPMFVKAYDFRRDVALVMVSNPDTSIYGDGETVYGYVNKSGKFICEKYFTEILRPFNDSTAIVTIKKAEFKLKKNGSLIPFLSEPKKGDSTAEGMVIVEQMPQYRGGDNKRLEFLQENINYPSSAKEAGYKGMTYVGFIVTKTGEVTEERIVCKTNIHPLLEKESIRVVKLMPDFIPGYQDGKAVSVSFTMPIKFSLN